MEQTVLDLVGELEFDPAELKTKYLAERDKRIRDDAFEQLIRIRKEIQLESLSVVSLFHQAKLSYKSNNGSSRMTIICVGYCVSSHAAVG